MTAGIFTGYARQGDLQPDWPYFEQADMTDPFFEKRVGEFLAAYYWGTDQKNTLVLKLLRRYSKLEHVSDEDFDQLQAVAVTCNAYVAKYLDKVENFSNQKDTVLGFLETMRRLLTEWIK